MMIVGMKIELLKEKIYLNATIAKKFGQVEKNCFQKAKEQANFLEEKGKGIDEIEDKLFVTCLATNIQPNDDVWYLESGCSNHLTGNINFFVDIDESVKPKFRLGENNQV